MINLIPNHEKKKKVRDFYFRLSGVFLASLGFAGAVATVSLLPAYFLSSIERNLHSEHLLEQKSAPTFPGQEQVISATKDLERKLALARTAAQKKYSVSDKVLMEIARRKMADIKITRIVYEYTVANGRTVRLSGVAPSRERLLSFRESLEQGTAFKKVELPISNFVQGEDIEFNLVLIPS